MNKKYIKKFNEYRSFLYLNGYITAIENEKIKKRFLKDAKSQGFELTSLKMLKKFSEEREY